jgi:hypothetical protein
VDQLTNEQIGWGISGIVYLLTCSGWGSYVAMAKHRPWGEGALLGAMLGPFGVIAAAGLPTLEPEPARLPAMPPSKPARFTDAEWARKIANPD